jgi:hypothetical protein
MHPSQLEVLQRVDRALGLLQHLPLHRSPPSISSNVCSIIDARSDKIKAK